MLKIKPLDEDLIYIANYNSYSGETGNVMQQTYIICAENIIRWGMPEERKQELLDELYNKWTVELANEVMGVRV